MDVVSRLMAPHLSQALGQSVVVENRPGAGGLIGTDYVAKQPADGYTLLVSHAAVLASTAYDSATPGISTLGASAFDRSHCVNESCIGMPVKRLPVKDRKSVV